MSIECDDRPGIVAAVSSFLADEGANLVDSQQHTTDPSGGTFVMRTLFTPAPMVVADRAAFEARFARRVAAAFGMRWRCTWSDCRPAVAILASKEDHAVLELLWRWRNGELPGEVVVVASNHAVLEPLVTPFGVPFVHLPIEAGRKVEQEERLDATLRAAGAELVVLARYMQILSPSFVAGWPRKIVNIHHSFLPAFVGADPYRQAFERGVKLVGATAHYVTDALDEGPIIVQDVTRVGHRDTVGDMRRRGRDLERSVLARAVEAHLEDAVLVVGDRTVVFETGGPGSVTRRPTARYPGKR